MTADTSPEQVGARPIEGKTRPNRRSRFRRAQRAGPLLLTPLRLRVLATTAELGLASTYQLARVLGLQPQALRRKTRLLFDAGLLDVLPAGRVSVAEGCSGDDPTLLFGSAPGIFSLSPQGARVLARLGQGSAERAAPRFALPSALLLRHHLSVVDAHVWLLLAGKRHPAVRLRSWREGGMGLADLPGRTGVKRPSGVRPDAWFVLDVGRHVLVGLLEADRGTERGGERGNGRGSRRWREKLSGYARLLEGEELKQLTGYANARVIVVVPDARRRGALSELIAREAPAIAPRFWLVVRSQLESGDLTELVWQQPGSQMLKCLLPATLLQEGGANDGTD